MTSLEQTAPAFVEMAHAIVWASVATVDADSKDHIGKAKRYSSVTPNKTYHYQYVAR